MTKAEFNLWKEALCRMRDERDNARREVCRWAARHFNEYSEHIARERGWDCFKEKP